MHSPFVFRWIREVRRGPVTHHLHRLRIVHRALKRSRDTVHYAPVGARASDRMRTVTIRQLARHVASGPRVHRVLHHLAARSTGDVLELGTSLGLGTAAMASAAPSHTVHTVEAIDALEPVERRVWTDLNLTNIRRHAGRFEEVIGALRPAGGAWGLIYIDGDHTEEATLRLVDRLWETSDEQTVLVLDDIHWSPGMERAWRTIRADERFTLSLDLHRLGILYRSPDILQKRHIALWPI